MSHSLELRWQTPVGELKDLKLLLYPFNGQTLGAARTAQQHEQQQVFEGLEAGSYLLHLCYQWNGQRFDSCYFQLDLPDVQVIQLRQGSAGAEINQMGCYNGGELIDMLIYEHQKPCLTRAIDSRPVLENLSRWLVFEAPHQALPEQRASLSLQVGDLSIAFPQLQYLWPWQIKALLQLPLLAQSTAAWKACLQHLLQNDAILLDNERLYENLQEAADLAQQSEALEAYLADLEWNPESQAWEGWDDFLAAIAGQYVRL